MHRCDVDSGPRMRLSHVTVQRGVRVDTRRGWWGAEGCRETVIEPAIMQRTKKLPNRNSPEPFDAVGVECLVVADYRHLFGQALCDQQPVERVAVMHGESCNDVEMLKSNL